MVSEEEWEQIVESKEIKAKHVMYIIHIEIHFPLFLFS